jgi:uncharacterized membrane protein
MTALQPDTRSCSPAARARRGVATGLDWIAVALFLFVLFIAATGGFSFAAGDVKVSAHGTENPALALVAALLVRRAVAPSEGFYESRVLAGILAALAALRRRMEASSRLSGRLVLALVVVYALAMSAATVRRHQSFHSNAYDLGIFDQVIWNTAYGDALMSSILGDRHYFSEHVSPILILLAPLYRLWADPILLLVLQTAALASGAIATYRIARHVLSSNPLATVFAFAYLAYQPLRQVNTFDFHPEALATPLLLFAFDALLHRRRATCSLLLALAILCKEDVAAGVCAFGVYTALFRRERLFGGAIAFVGLAAFVLDLWVIAPHFRGGEYGFFERYAYLGESPGDIGLTLLSRPGYVLSHVVTLEKLKYLFEVLGPFAFLSLLAPGELLLAGPALAESLLSGYEGQFSIGYHYTAALTPFVVVSAIHGLRNLLASEKLRRILRLRSRSDLLSIRAAALLVFLGCILVGKSPAALLQLYRTTPDEMAIHAVLGHVPAAASLSAQGVLVPHLAHRRSVYQFPELRDAEYVALAASRGIWPQSRDEYLNWVSALLKGGDYGVVVQEGAAVLMRKGHGRELNARALGTIEAAVHSTR